MDPNTLSFECLRKAACAASHEWLNDNRSLGLRAIVRQFAEPGVARPYRDNRISNGVSRADWIIPLRDISRRAAESGAAALHNALEEMIVDVDVRYWDSMDFYHAPKGLADSLVAILDRHNINDELV